MVAKGLQPRMSSRHPAAGVLLDRAVQVPKQTWPGGQDVACRLAKRRKVHLAGVQAHVQQVKALRREVAQTQELGEVAFQDPTALKVELILMTEGHGAKPRFFAGSLRNELSYLTPTTLSLTQQSALVCTCKAERISVVCGHLGGRSYGRTHLTVSLQCGRAVLAKDSHEPAHRLYVLALCCCSGAFAPVEPCQARAKAAQNCNRHT